MRILFDIYISRVFLLISFVLFLSFAQGQNSEDEYHKTTEDPIATDISLNGILSDYHSNQPITTATTTISSEEKEVRNLKVDSMGGWIDLIPCDHLYKIEFSAPGYISKHVIIDARSIPLEEQLGGFSMDIDITLFRKIDGIDFSLFEKPVGVSKYDPYVYAIAWDSRQVKRVQDEMKRLMKSYDKAFKDSGLDKDR